MLPAGCNTSVAQILMQSTFIISPKVLIVAYYREPLVFTLSIAIYIFQQLRFKFININSITFHTGSPCAEMRVVL